MKEKNNNNLVYYQFESMPGEGTLNHGVFTRLGGVSTGHYDSLNVGSTVGDHPKRVMHNRHLIAGAMGVRDRDTQTTWQVHGADVIIAGHHDPQAWPPPKADAIVTNQEGLPLVMRFADCVPLMFFDPVKRVLGMAHAGWRGTVAGVGAATVLTMVEQFGSIPENIIAGVGPSIGPCCYEVGPEVVQQVKAAFSDSSGLIHPSDNNPHLDLWEANHRTLRQAGLTQIEVSGMCTACNTHLFYSHRAENGQTGRFGMLAVMNNGDGQ